MFRDGIAEINKIQFDPKKNEQIRRFKIPFSRGEAETDDCPFIPKIVAKSWNRCRNMGFQFDRKTLDTTLREDYSFTQHQQLLVRAAMPMFKGDLGSLFDITGICLCDEKGTVLYVSFARRNQNHQLKMTVGSSILEEFNGTNAASLCLQYKRPVQLLGALHYCTIFENDFSCAAPIFDDHNELLGALVIVRNMSPEQLQNDMKNILPLHLMGWAISFSQAIETQIKLIKKNQSLILANGVLEATISALEDGLITLDPASIIIKSNREAVRILGSPAEELTGIAIQSLLPEISSALSIAQAGEPVHDFEITLNHRGRKYRYILTLLPVITEEQEAGESYGVVIRLIYAEKINRLLSKRSGKAAVYHFDDIIGDSAVMQETISKGKRLAKSPDNILLLGESGTGKEIFSQAIHNVRTPEGPFMAINCASMPRNLIESELFGYEQGSFTGADKKGRPGKIELANGGTLFLDEIGDMPLEIQPILLRVIEDKEVIRLGGDHYTPVDFRVIAATNKDLFQLVQEKQFREDLYFRLSIFKLRLPPLRERQADIRALAYYFLKVVAARQGIGDLRISDQAMTALLQYDWPGNVRQLENCIVYAATMAAETKVIEERHLSDELRFQDHRRTTKIPPTKSGQSFEDKGKPRPLKELEQEAILKALHYTDNDTSLAANLLGMSRPTLYRRIKDYGIDLK